MLGGKGWLTRREEFIFKQALIEVNTGKERVYEISYRKSLTRDDILFLLIRFGNRVVVKPV